MANKVEWELLLNPAFQRDLKKSTTFPKFLRQVNYKDRCIIQQNGSWIEGEVHGFNVGNLYLFDEYEKMNTCKWNDVKFIKKKLVQNEKDQFIYIEEKTNIIAVIFAIVIFVGTFLLGYIYSYLPMLFPK